MDYHRSLRLHESKEMLKEKTISEVATKCGFSTIKGFKMAYYKKFGEYPVTNNQVAITEEF